MKKEEIHLWDIKRILFGEAPPEFLLEVFIRSLITYILAIVVMRLMGKRMNGQLTIIELAVIVMMGAIVAVPMQIPDRGIVQGFIVLAVTLLCLRGTHAIAFRSTGFEKFVQGEASILVKDGVLDLKELKKTRITQQQVFEILRSKKIFQLGKVKRMYLEGCGIFSVYIEERPKPGLPLYPPDDKSMLEEHQAPKAAPVVCINCGTPKPENELQKTCRNCGNNEFTKAIV